MSQDSDIDLIWEFLKDHEVPVGDLFRDAINRVHDRINAVYAENDQLRKRIVELQGITPEFSPMYQTDMDILPRYGLRWNGPERPVCIPMINGYWTPWHMAQFALDDAIAAQRGEGE